ncbi:magnesium transporter MRS2-F-like [Macadamia integrifolia]|uniref:magnesium transporter MRS2-F-like n=1 Tax=Macadamia integrifolia TaxID=60698 RepID=UPI001C4ED971|nr:magnesium transporter MRS2-F-like [Macadamia integrifolia]
MRARKSSSDEELNHTTIFPPQTRRKGIGIRKWLVLSESGQSHLEDIGKHSIMKRTGLPARDLRVLDPIISYPFSIFGRERAIVINLEHIKAIITATEVFVLNSKDPAVVPFVQDLQNRVMCSNVAAQRATEGFDNDMEVTEKESQESPSFHAHHGSEKPANLDISQLPHLSKDNSMPKMKMKGSSPMTAVDVAGAEGTMMLPFEFRALEACLESACRCLDYDTSTLEQEAYPALDELTSKISTLTLERVRQIKSRLVAISGRVQKVRDELEHLLDDDNDMAEMYLTEKLVSQSLDQISLSGELDNDSINLHDEREEETKTDGGESLTTIKPNIEELEMLLEAYFIQIDGILNELSMLREYVDDTEDYVNIMLDDKQNQLLQMGVVLTTANLVINAGIVVVGLFGMNIHISLFDGVPGQFWGTALGTMGGVVAIFYIAVGWSKTKGLLA